MTLSAYKRKGCPNCGNISKIGNISGEANSIDVTCENCGKELNVTVNIKDLFEHQREIREG